MRYHTTRSTMSQADRLGSGLLTLFLATLGLFLLGTGTASASKQIVNYFGTPPVKGTVETAVGSGAGEFEFPQGVAVNNSGAGPASQGDIYVTDWLNNRIQRFAHDDNGTPANPYDDTYPFLGAWGAGVESGGSDYEICTVAASCTAGNATGGNGTAAGNGALAKPVGIAVDQDTGDLYVSDSVNNRIDVYDGTGTFLRAFGWDVVESGPDNAGTGYEVCVAANGDVCKAGLPGSGIGQIGAYTSGHSPGRAIAVSPPDGNPATGTVFFADSQNKRINTYSLTGSSPASFGSAALFTGEPFPHAIAVDSNGIVYASNSANNNEIERYDSENADGGGVGFLAPIGTPPLIAGEFQPTEGLAVDFSTGALYALRREVVQQLGPLNPPGLTAPPSAIDEVHGEGSGLQGEAPALALDETDGSIYVLSDRGGSQEADGVYVLNTPSPSASEPPTASLDSLSGITSHSAIVHATVNPNGPPVTGYYLEYSTDGTNWRSTPEVTLGSQETPQSVEAVLDPPLGLQPNTLYHVRLVAQKRFLSAVTTAEKTFTTLTGSPLAETTGSPLRTSTTARLDSRVDPGNSTATYHFEYGDQGPCDANPCTATEPHPAGSGNEFELVSQQLTELEPNTTYHYRVVVDNGNAGSPVFGEDMTVTTFASDAPLSHGHLPGPSGSDRAWELVSAPDSGGNPVFQAASISDQGDRAVYQVFGGSPLSETGTLATRLFAERTPSGWQTKAIFPHRDQATESTWSSPGGPRDLSELVVANYPAGFDGEFSAWRMTPSGSATKLNGTEISNWGSLLVVSEDASRVLTLLKGSQDPAHPAEPGTQNLYDISAGSPHLISLLPGGAVPACGVTHENQGFPSIETARRSSHWVSPDGSLAFFPSRGNNCNGPEQLYLRDIEAETTELISTPPVSGSACNAAFIKSTPGAVFFSTQSRLVAKDTAPASCNGDGDVYRYDLGDGTLDCVTCVVAGVNAAVQANNITSQIGNQIGVAEDGSRVYFESSNRLLPGAPPKNGIYRVNVATGNLAYIAHLNDDFGFDFIGEGTGSAITPSGSVAVFRAKDPSLNALGGQQNAGTYQFYRYDDRDRSLVCVSCPADGSAPKGEVNVPFPSATLGANTGPLSGDGEDFAFTTPTALVSADQNTAGVGQKPQAGTDVYEWRDGRVLLVSDGLTNWPANESPTVSGITPSGHDLFFNEAAQLTPDALDGYKRLYDARIGGGFEFPPPPKPCPLEVCQGTPKGAPEEAAPGTSSFAGPGNSQAHKHHKKRHKKAHRKKQARHKHKANNKRRAAR